MLSALLQYCCELSVVVKKERVSISSWVCMQMISKGENEQTSIRFCQPGRTGGLGDEADRVESM